MSTFNAQTEMPVDCHMTLKGIRHINKHETILCVLHIDDESSPQTTLNNNQQRTQNALCDKPKTNKKCKSVSFGCIEYTNSSSSSNSSLCSEDGYSNTTTMNKYEHSASPPPTEGMHEQHILQNLSISSDSTRKKHQPLKPSPLVGSSSDNNPSSLLNSKKPIDSLGLSPSTRRRNLTPNPIIDDTSSIASSSYKSRKQMTVTPISKTPLHSGFIGSEEELEQLRFIKNALSNNAVPISPEIMRKRANTIGTSGEKRLNAPLEDYRARVSSMESMKNNKLRNKHIVLPKIAVERVKSAH